MVALTFQLGSEVEICPEGCVSLSDKLIDCLIEYIESICTYGHMIFEYISNM